jgi:hypothetical protein
MASNLSSFLSGSVSPFIKNETRRKSLMVGAAYGAAGAAAMIGGSMYNRSQGQSTFGGGLAQGAGLASMAMGARSMGVGRLLTAGGMQRMGNRFNNAANRLGEGRMQNALYKSAEVFHGSSEYYHKAATSMQTNAFKNPKSKMSNSMLDLGMRMDNGFFTQY